MQLALHFPVHPLVFCVHLFNEKFLPFFSESFIPVVHFFQNTHTHITYSMPLLVEMKPCSFVQMSVGDIPPMFRKSILQAPVRLSNILLCTFLAGNAVDHVLSLTVHCSVNVYSEAISCRLHTVARLNKWANRAIQTLFHSYYFSFGPLTNILRNSWSKKYSRALYQFQMITLYWNTEQLIR